MDKFLGIHADGKWIIFNTEQELRNWAEPIGSFDLSKWVFRRLGPKIDLTLKTEVVIG